MRLASGVFVAWAGIALAQTPPSWNPEFSLQFQNVGSVTPSPDGKWVVWAQTKNVLETEKSEQVTQIWIASVDGSKRIQLTRGEKSCSSPAFSPDGQFVYFASDRGGKRNIYRIPVTRGEAEQITDFKGTLGNFEISPDGKTIAFQGYDPPSDIEKAKKEKRDMRVVDADPQIRALYTAPAEADADGKRAQKKLVDGKYDIVAFNWSPDSKNIAFQRQPTPIADDWTRSDITEVEVSSGKLKDIAATPAAESDPLYSPDGRFVAYTRSATPARWAGETRIVLAPRAGGNARELSMTADEQPNLIGWSPDSRRILYFENKRTRSGIFAMPIDGPAQTVYEPARGLVRPGAVLNRAGTHLGFRFETSDDPPEAYVLAVGGTPVMVSRANKDIPLPPSGKTEVVRWKSKDGLEVEGLLTYPVNYEKGKKVPLILNIHGGPAGVFSEAFTGAFTVYPIAAFSARGYAVLRPNPRGSSGYGKQFRFGNYSDWGGKDYEDDQTGVDKVIEMGVADPDRLAVMGWSYGGFMTSWTITQTNRFKAAAIGAGVTNLWSFTGTADIAGFLPDYFGGEPWEQFANFQKHSPISHIKNVKTPTLVLHGEADLRVPVSQGYEYYNALKRQGVTAKMVVYPRTPHGPSEPKFVLDIMQRHLDWVETYVR